MADFGIIATFDHSAAALRPAPRPRPPAVPAAEAAGAGRGLSGRMSGDGSAGASGGDAAMRQASLIRDRDPIAGPPPSFQANVLELDRDLRAAIARLEAARGKQESQIAGLAAGAVGTAAGETQASPPETATDVAEGPNPAQRNAAEATAAPARAG